MPTEDAVDDDFNAGFNEPTPTLTPTPDVVDSPIEEAVAKVEEPAPAPEPEYAKITKTDYDDLLRRAASIDEVKTEHKKLLDSAFGRLGSQQQLLERLQSSTQAGKPVEVTPADFEELVNEGFTELANMQAAGLNRILGKMQLRGTAPVESLDPAKIGEIFDQRFTPQREQLTKELRESIRADLAKEALEEAHEGWMELVNTKEFNEWADANKIREKKDRSGVLFEESINANFVGKVIADFKAQQKKSSARQNVLEASVAPRGSGGIAPSSTEDDEFLKGFNS